MASEVIAGVVIGLVLDWAFGSRPWCVLAFTLAGMVFGMRSFIRKARQEQSLHGQRRAVTREEGNPR